MSNTPVYYRLPTLYPTQKDASRALDVAINLLKGDGVGKDNEGFCLIKDLCQEIIKQDESFGYMNRNHVIELFFRDPDRKILISGEDRIKYKEVIYVQPPDTLYFGTIENFVSKMKIHGIRSNTKGYIKLYRDPQEACRFAEKFTRDGERTVALEIDSKKAFSDGLKFSTFKDGEYIVVQLFSRYIK